MARILVLGASGPTGRHVVDQALQQGHDVTAFVRDPARLPVQHARLRVVAGDATDPDAVRQAVRGQDAVISTLGVGQSFASNELITRSVPNIVTAMQGANVRRLVFTSAFGVGASYRDVPLVPRIFMGTLLRGIYADKRMGEELLRASDLDWTLVCPTGLSNAPGTGTYRVGERLELRGFPTIPRADVAHFLLTQVSDRRYSRKEVLVSS